MEYFKEDDTDEAYYGFPFFFHSDILFDAIEKCGIDYQNATTLISQDKDNKNIIMIIKADRIDPCDFLKSLTYMTSPDYIPILKSFNFDDDDNIMATTFDKNSSNIWIDLKDIIKSYYLPTIQHTTSLAILPPPPVHDIISILLIGNKSSSSSSSKKFQHKKILTVQTFDANGLPYCSIPILHSLTLIDFLNHLKQLGITQSNVSKTSESSYIVTLELNYKHFKLVKNLITTITLPYNHQKNDYDLIEEDFSLVFNEAKHKSIALNDLTADIILNYVQ